MKRKRKTVEISIHLPLYYNPTSRGKRRRVQYSKFDETYQEVATKFGGYTVPRNVEGYWVDPQRGKVYRDLQHILFVIAEDKPDTWAWIREFKATLARRFRQREIMINVSSVRRV